MQVGPFRVEDAIPLDKLTAPGYTPAAHLRPIETALDDIPALAVDGDQADKLRKGQAVQVPRAASDDLAPPIPAKRPVAVFAADRLIAIATVEDGLIRPLRVINRRT